MRSLRVLLTCVLVYGVALAGLAGSSLGEGVPDGEAAALVGGACADYNTFTCFSGPEACPDTTCYLDTTGGSVKNKNYTKTYPCGGNKTCSKVYTCLQDCKKS